MQAEFPCQNGAEVPDEVFECLWKNHAGVLEDSRHRNGETDGSEQCRSFIMTPFPGWSRYGRG